MKNLKSVCLNTLLIDSAFINGLIILALPFFVFCCAAHRSNVYCLLLLIFWLQYFFCIDVVYLFVLLLLLHYNCIGLVIASVYRASGLPMTALTACLYGLGQTVVVVFISFTRLLATL